MGFSGPKSEGGLKSLNVPPRACGRGSSQDGGSGGWPQIHCNMLPDIATCFQTLQHAFRYLHVPTTTCEVAFKVHQREVL
jgi:hypothetical protein